MKLGGSHKETFKEGVVAMFHMVEGNLHGKLMGIPIVDKLVSSTCIG
jgi:hypothetical protein